MIFDATSMTIGQARRAEMRDDIDHQPRVAPRFSPINAVHPMVGPLRAAAKAFADQQAAQPRRAFVHGKAGTCLDMAAKLERFGSFVSDKQADFADKLVEWSKPRDWAMPATAHDCLPGHRDHLRGPQAAPGAPAAAPVAPSPAPAPVVRLERLFALMQRLSKLTIGNVTIARKNQDSLCWVKHADFPQVVGKIENGVLVLFTARLRAVGAEIGLTSDLLRIEADPEAAAVLHGKASGRCSVCSRDLTDPASIARGIGPTCALKFC